MHTLDLLRMIFDNLRRQKGRVVLTALGVVIGTASIVLLVSLASGMQENMMNQFSRSGMLTSINVYPSDPNMGAPMGEGPGAKPAPASNSQKGLLTTTVAKQISAIPGVTLVIPRVGLEAYGVLSIGKLENGGYVLGVGTKDVRILDIQVAQGTSMVGRNEAIIGGWAAKNFYSTSAGPGGYSEPQAPDLLDKRIRFTIYKYTEEGDVKKT